MKYLLLLSFILPKDTLPPTADLLAALQQYHVQQTHAQLAEYAESTKGEWLKYIPSVGVTYTVAGQPRPSVSFSTATIYTARKGKQLRAAKVKAIEANNSLVFQEAQRKLLQLIGNYYQEVESLAFAEEIQEIEEQIFAIQQSKFDNLELTPLQFLPIKRAFLQGQYKLMEQRKALLLLEKEVLVWAKWRFEGGELGVNLR